MSVNSQQNYPDGSSIRLLLPPLGEPSDSLKYFILLESVASTTHGLQVTDVMVRWITKYHVVDSPVITFKVFVAAYTHRVKDCLSVCPSLMPLFTAMPISHVVSLS